MKTIGLLGGMSWESTTDYYRLINEGIKQQLGGLHSAKIILNSVDFAPIEKFQHQNNWPAMADILTEAATSVERAGADFLLICTNTMHRLAPEVSSAINIPLLHIGDAVAEKIKQEGVNKVGLLGTAFTMEQEFFKSRLVEKHGIEVLIPNKNDREIVHQVIYDELCLGQIKSESKNHYLRIIEDLNQKGAEAVILGCTEIGLLVKQQDTQTQLFDTTQIHAEMAVKKSIS